MSNKQQFLKFLTETSDAVFEKFHGAFGLDDWSEATKDFPEAQELLEKKLQLFDWELKRNAEKQRDIILKTFDVFLRDNEGKKENEYTRTEFWKDLYSRR